MRVYQVMTTDPVAVDVDDDIEDALELMHEFGIEQVPVTEDGRVVGVLTEAATRAAAAAVEESDLPAWPAARRLMRPGAVTVHPVASVEEAGNVMGNSGARTIYVTAEDGRLIGSVSDTDLVDWYGDGETEAALTDLLPLLARQRSTPPHCPRV
jgi:acetoin utilization protein AcuB